MITIVNQNIFGERLRTARENAKLKQTDVADIMDITSASLSQYEAGKRKVDALTLDRLAKLYSTPLTFFFSGEESVVPQWEDLLRQLSEPISQTGKTGISKLINWLKNLETLYEDLEVDFPGIPHAPFEALPSKTFPEYEVANYAEKVRRHFDLGIAPLTKLRNFLESNGYLIFAVSLGDGKDDLSGLFFRHNKLGPVIAINKDQSFTRRPFTIAHEFAHSNFHYDRNAILCRHNEKDTAIEKFADSFASHFLVPQEALHEQLRKLNSKKVSDVEDIVHLAQYFGVSFRSIRKRLIQEKRIETDLVSKSESVKSLFLAKQLGYTIPDHMYFSKTEWPLEMQVPRQFLSLAYRAVCQPEFSSGYVANLLGISKDELDERLSENRCPEDNA